MEHRAAQRETVIFNGWLPLQLGFFDSAREFAQRLATYSKSRQTFEGFLKKNYKYQNYLRFLEGTLNSSNSKSAVNPYFQRELPESAPTHIRNNLARHLGCRKVSNQQWSAYLDLIRLSGLFGFFSQSEQKSEKSSIRTANSLDMIF